MYTHMHMYIDMYMNNYIYIYIYRERERDVYTYIYIYIYTHNNVLEQARGRHLAARNKISIIAIMMRKHCTTDNNNDNINNYL